MKVRRVKGDIRSGDLARDEAGWRPDWSRERRRRWSWTPSRALIGSIRDYQRAAARHGPFAAIARRSAILRHRFWSVVTGADIPLNVSIGGGMLLPHPNGVVIHPEAEIGPNCCLFQQVTIGKRGPGGAPKLGCWVEAGAGARILGGVTIGDHALIGANAVVLSDVPPRTIMVGAPARPVGVRDEAELRGREQETL
ncbi:MAG: serine acetyltransferase [Sphingomonas sp.]|uniref:Serine acetyltransferase n=1 Tax=Edaphosphingomonas haloaromaticamans TaxID=653954 RepID=A0A1S1HBW3_9SPHN|nr:serine acetyltransferase [Sphingomonas sp.]MDX3884744.1 serine acetyltransferase [Sphingomonas sp.]OHT19729.1 Serine acetyltransferase [Sphingomonas haloaromaticamans]